MAGRTRLVEEDRPRLGRPPRISRQMIAEAAHELGLEGLTLRAVARHLDVSIAGLYHHVSGKDELMRLAAEYSASKVPLPKDRGQHWALWLLEWATYNRDVFVAQPGLLTQYLDGAIAAETIAGNVDAILGLLVRQGFSVTEANAAYELVTSCAIGSAVGSLREREAVKAGRSIRRAHEQVVEQSEAGDLPYLRDLMKSVAKHGRQTFEEKITTVLIGIAIRQGEDWRPIATKIDRSVSRRGNSKTTTAARTP